LLTFHHFSSACLALSDLLRLLLVVAVGLVVDGRGALGAGWRDGRGK
jgi:hypothetical protein